MALFWALPARAILIPPHVTHVTPVPPKSCSTWGTNCELLVADGSIGNLEYADAARVPLQDFASGNATGEMWIRQGHPERLNLALRVSRGGECQGQECGVWYTIILLDARRGDTLTNLQAATEVREDDRAILITHFSPSQFAVQYLRGVAGQNTWIEATSLERWPALVQAKPKGPWLEVELEILLRPDGSTQPSEVLGNGKMGLGVFHFRFDPDSDASTLHYWPGNAGMDEVFQLVNAPNFFIPYTWATIEFKRPDPTPLSLMTYNLGLVPLVADGGSGTVENYAAIAATVGGPEVMCFQEVWSHDDRIELAELSDFLWKVQFPGDAYREIQEAGAPQVCGGLTDPFCNPEELIIPGYGGTGLATADTGLLVLSKNPIFASEVREYDESLCAGADCLEAKGAIWARVGTSAARKVVGHDGEKVIYDAEEYVDVFCTHVQASCDGWAKAIGFVSEIVALGLGAAFPGLNLEALISECDDALVRDIQASQLAELRTFIDQKAQPRDRPAFVVGDFNANPGGDAYQLGLYGQILSHLGLLTLTPFDAANQLFTKRYDIGLGCRGQLPYSVPPVIPTAACNPVLTPDVTEYIWNLPPGPKWPRIGVGTNIAQDEYCDALQFGTLGDVDSARYDHVLIYPAAGAPGDLPVFAIPNDPEPYVTVNSYPDPHPQGPRCFSDHKAVTAHIDLVRLKDKLSFNPNMTHEITYTMNRVENLTGDSSGGAEFYSKFRYTDAGGTEKPKNYGVYKDDSDVIYPNWHVKNLFSGGELFRVEFQLWEEDVVNDDPYDVTRWSGARVWSRFRHDTSVWTLRDQAQHVIETWCFEKLHPDCFAFSGGTLNILVDNVGTSPNSERARIQHSLSAVEVPQ